MSPRRALVTGASAGIGRALARKLSAGGAEVVLVARRRDRLEELARELGQAEVLVADLAAPRGLESVADRLARGDVDLLVNNAGFGTVGAFIESPAAREMEQVDLLVRAVVRLSHAALTAMAPRRAGGILNVASMAAFQPVPYNAVYSASKAFVRSFSEALHEEAKPHGVTVTCACLGPVATEFQAVAKIRKQTLPMRRLVRAMAKTGIDQVTREMLVAYERGDAVCVPGGLNLAIAWAAETMPRAFVRRMAGRFYRKQ